MIAGKEITLGGNKYVVPPLPWIALRTHKDLLKRLTRGELDPESLFDKDFEAIFNCVYLTLKRNYPALTEDALAADLDVRNMREAINAMMGVGGFDEAAPPGEPGPVKS